MIARIEAASPAVRQSIVTCRIGGEQYALRGSDAWEVVRAERMRRASADGAVGAIEVAGETAPVYSLAAVLGLPGQTMPGRRPSGDHIVVTRGAAGLAGWLVDRIARTSLDAVPQVRPLPRILGPVAARWFEGLLTIDEDVRLLLSPSGLDPRNTSEPEHLAVPPAAGAPKVERAPDDERGPALVILFATAAIPPCDAPQYALSARRVAAVVQPKGTTKVPGSAAWTPGVMVWRDTVIPVIDIRAAAPGWRTPAPERHLVARSGPAPADLVAFPVIPPVTLHEATRADVAVGEDGRERPPFVAGVYGINGQAVAFLDIDRLLPALAANGTGEPDVARAG